MLGVLPFTDFKAMSPKNVGHPSFPSSPVPRIELVECSPVVGQGGPAFELSRSPSMPAVLSEPVPAYRVDASLDKTEISRPLTSLAGQSSLSPRLGGFDAFAQATSPAASSISKTASLPLPGTPSTEDNTRQLVDYQRPVFGTRNTISDTSQSVPVTFSFPETQSADSWVHRRDAHTFAHTEDGYAHSADSHARQYWEHRSCSLSNLSHSSHGRVLRVMNPDPPSSTTSRTTSPTPRYGNIALTAQAPATLAQKRFVSSPPAPIQVDLAQQYASASLAVDVIQTPVSKSSGKTVSTPVSASSGAASSPSFRFSDAAPSPRSPISPATPVSTASGLNLPRKTVQAVADTAVSSDELVAPTPARKRPAAGRKQKLKTASMAGKIDHAKKMRKSHKPERSLTLSSAGIRGDESEAVESCFESAGACSDDYPAASVAAKRRLRKATLAWTRQGKVRKVRSPTADKKKDSKPEAEVAHPRAPRADVELRTSTKSKQSDATVRDNGTAALRSPLSLSRHHFTAHLGVGAAPSGIVNGFSTMWTPIGRVVIPSATRSVSDSRPVQPAPMNGGRKVSAPAGLGLEAPPSPRPPTTRRLGNENPLSRSDSGLLRPPPAARSSLFASATTAPTTARLHAGPRPTVANYEAAIGRTRLSRSERPAAAHNNRDAKLSLPLPSPMRLDAFTTELLARCGVTTDAASTAVPAAIPTSKPLVPPPKSAVEAFFSIGAEKDTTSAAGWMPSSPRIDTPRPGTPVPFPNFVPKSVVAGSSHDAYSTSVLPGSEALRETLVAKGAILPDPTCRLEQQGYFTSSTKHAFDWSNQASPARSPQATTATTGLFAYETLTTAQAAPVSKAASDWRTHTRRNAGVLEHLTAGVGAHTELIETPIGRVMAKEARALPLASSKEDAAARASAAAAVAARRKERRRALIHTRALNDDYNDDEDYEIIRVRDARPCTTGFEFMPTVQTSITGSTVNTGFAALQAAHIERGQVRDSGRVPLSKGEREERKRRHLAAREANKREFEAATGVAVQQATYDTRLRAGRSPKSPRPDVANAPQDCMLPTAGNLALPDAGMAKSNPTPMVHGHDDAAAAIDAPEGGAVRLGEYKRGFDFGEIERWLVGVVRPAPEPTAFPAAGSGW